MTGATVEPKGAQSSLEGRGSRGFAPSRLFAALSRIDQATREALIVAAATAGLWLLIERTEICDRLFHWIAKHPDTEVDSFVLAFMIAALGMLVFATRRWTELRAEVRERQAAQQRAHTLAYHDPLTGLANRRALMEQIDALVSIGPDSSATGLLIIDLDRFKAVNDVHGHLAGDRLLLAVAARLQEEIADHARSFRLGGDEFAVLIKLVTIGPDGARSLARRIVRRMGEPFCIEGLVHHIGASIGISMWPGDAQDCETLIRQADIALYRAKDAGRNCLSSFEPAMDEKISRRAAIEVELRAAIAGAELQPHFQPIVDLRTRATIGFELLARWPRRDGVDVGPDEFIPIAEESGLIGKLMLQLLRSACEEARGWEPRLTLAINVSPAQLQDPWLAQEILAVLTATGFSPKRLVVEITEDALIVDSENLQSTIESLTNQGVGISLDDFGKGYSSIQHLRMLPFSKIKIDRSFVHGLVGNPQATRLVDAIISMATKLGLPVVAEGVEDEATAQFLCELGCDQAQGYHFGRAVPGSAVGGALDYVAQLRRGHDRPDFRVALSH